MYGTKGTGIFKDDIIDYQELGWIPEGNAVPGFTCKNSHVNELISLAGGYSEKYLMGQWRQWRQIPAVRNNRVHVVDAGLFDRPTGRLVEGLEILAVLIHPELFFEKREDRHVVPEKSHPEKK